MKVKNMKDGMQVVVKKNATVYAADYIGQVGILRETYTHSLWRVIVGNDSFTVLPKEVRKVREGDLE